MSSKILEFYFDVGSPATYLAWTQMPRIEADTLAQIVRKPMLLGGVFKATGNQSPAMVLAKGKYMLTDLERFAQRYDVPFANNPHFPIDTLQLMRMITGVQIAHPERFLAFTDLIFRSMWVDRLDLGNLGVLSGLLEKAGFSAAEIAGFTTAQDVKEKLRANTEEAVRRGAFGAPTFFVGDEMYFGQDRLDFVVQALRA